MRAKRTTPSRAAEASWQLREAATTLLMAGMAVALIAALTLLYKQQFGPTGFYRPEYEGRIVHKSLTGHETQEGSRVERKLLIEGDDGVRFEVRVGPEVYERAEVGMRIKVGKAQVELTRPEPRSTDAGSAR